MKAVITFFLVLFLSVGASAQKKQDHDKMEHHKMDSFLDDRPLGPVYCGKTKEVKTEKIARLYRFKNARIKAELSFKTKKQHFTV